MGSTANALEDCIAGENEPRCPKCGFRADHDPSVHDFKSPAGRVESFEIRILHPKSFDALKRYFFTDDDIYASLESSML